MSVFTKSASGTLLLAFLCSLCSLANAGIVEQRIDENGIYIRTSDGREFKMNTSQIASRISAESGSRLTRKIKAESWTADEIVKILGEANITKDMLRISLDENGRPIDVRMDRSAAQ